MSADTEAPKAETETPAPNGADTSAPAEKAAPDGGDDFLGDDPESKAKPEGKADDGKDDAKADAEGKDFLDAETDDDDAEKDADAPGDADKEGAAEAYQPFELPDGITLADEDLAEATALFRKHERTQEQAQELVSFHAKQVQKTVEGFHQSLVEAHDQRLKEWTEAVKTDPVYGGKNLTQSKADVVRVLALEPEARKELRAYGLDRNPAVFRLLASIGSKLSDDSLVRDDAGAPEKAPPQRDADLMYS